VLPARSHDYFGIERTLDYYLANSLETQHHFCLMTRPELQQLAAAGMTIGAHSLSHPVLSQMSQELAWIEITQSPAQLEAALGKPIWAFDYPSGDAARGSNGEAGWFRRRVYEQRRGTNYS